ncbi:AMP-binding protein [Caenimonas aquaedulcis]|uniref:AMP-binding protein n=1 Tax=Caenimonas aquaedulcis TaxID=2793270 RepID=A0A931H8U5_9BURK|nr:AMP-binding protein [Caenimonas aquaedulcis]MBG9390450.1 AMP-binding protein [Caenimonas aquaedulcis]
MSDPAILPSARPTEEDTVVRHLIDRHARDRPDEVFALFEDGSHWTFAQLKSQVVAAAALLANEGVAQGDIVAVWMPNGPDALRMMLAVNYLGGTCAPLGLASRGGFLEHILNNSEAKLIAVDSRLMGRLAEVQARFLRKLVVVRTDGDRTPTPDGFEIVEQALDIGAAHALPALAQPIQPWDSQFVLYTSGTTGPSKGVLTSYMQRYAHAFSARHITAADRRLIHAPLSHTGGIGNIYGMLARGGSIALVESFKTDRFWSDVRRFGITTTSLLGVTLPYLLQQPESAQDRSHPLRTIQIAPVDESAAAFSKRFGVDVYGVYNMTEISAPFHGEPNPTVRGLCGRPRPGVEARVVDDNDLPLEDGQVGELVIRCAEPWTLMNGYLREPQATADVWRNGWFHTGDAFRKTEQGDFIFADRLKDAVRRRGENISSFEVESEIARHPQVREVAVVAAKSELSEDEVLAVVSPVEGGSIEPEALIDSLRSRLPYFMIPRYIRIMGALPRTATQKIMKHQLRAEGVTPDTWDRDKAGVVVKRDRL